MDSRILCQAECAVIGTMINCPATIGTVVKDVAPDDFSQLGCRGLYDAIADLFLAGAPVDEITVLAKAGGDYSPMMQACIGYYRPDDISYLCQLIMEQSRLVAVHKLAERILRAEDLESAKATLDRINASVVLGHSTEVVSIADAARDFLVRLKSEETPEYLTTGMRELDDALFLERGDVLVLGGYPSAGKTLLSVQMSLHLAEKYRVGYYSLETKTKKLVDRLFAYKAHVPLRDIKTHQLTAEGWQSIEKSVNEVSKLHWSSINAGGKTVRDIQSIALASRHEVVIVDYLQLIRSTGKDRYEQVTNISKDLHTMAQESNIAVIALAQLSRPQTAAGKAPAPPTMNSFRESGQIEQDADIALLLYPEDINDYKSNRILKVGKNKEGEKKVITLSFDGQHQTMTPIPDESPASYWSGIGRQAKAANRRRSDDHQITFQEIDDDSDLPEEWRIPSGSSGPPDPAASE